MNKADLVEKVAVETKLSRSDVKKAIESTLELTRKALKKGEDVRLAGFGSFVRVKRSARSGRNPQTGKTIQIKACWVPKFRAASGLKNYVR